MEKQVDTYTVVPGKEESSHPWIAAGFWVGVGLGVMLLLIYKRLKNGGK